jgi:hypothetical protein
MEELLAYRQELLSALNDFIDELSETVADIPVKAWQLPFERASLTPHYILAHLRELEDQVFALQLPRILDEDIPLLPIFDEDNWMIAHYDPGIPAQVILEQFVRLRKREISWLRELPPDSWSRIARHPWWGLNTFQWWVELQLEYSLQHIGQLITFITM